MQIGSLEIQLMADIARLRRDLDGAQRVVSDATSRMARMADFAKGALGTLGGAISIGALLSSINDAITVLGDLDGMAQKTGASIENLSRLQKVATVFDEDMGKIDAAVVKLAKGMTSFDEESSKARKGLSALGISATDSAGQLRDPAEVMIEMAQRLQNYKDGAAKTALINDVLGKSGADLLPYLNDLAENYDKVAAESADSAAAAAALQDQMGWAKLRVKELSGVVATAAVPAINDLFGAFIDVTKAQKGMATPDVRTWADDLAVGLARVADVAYLSARATTAVASSFKVVIADLEVAAAIAKLRNPANVALEYAKGNDPMADIKRAVAERNRVLADANSKYDDLWNKPANQFEQAVLKRIAERGTAAAEAGNQAVQSVLTYSSASDEAAKAARREADEQAKLLAELSGVTGTYMEDLSRLVAIREKGNIGEAQYVELVKELIEKQPAAKKWMDEQKKAQEDSLKVVEEAIGKNAETMRQLQERARGLEVEIELYGRGAEAAVYAEAAKVRATAGSLAISEEYRAELVKQAEELDRIAGLVKRKAELDEEKKLNDQRLTDQVKLWGDIERTAHDTFISIFDSGKSAFDRLKDALKNGLYELLYQMTVKKWIVNISGQVSGAGGLSTSATGGDLLSNLFGGNGSGGSGAMGMLQNGMKLYDAFKGGFAGIGSNIGQGMSYLGNAMGNNSIFSFGQGMQGFNAGGVGSGISGQAAGYGQIASGALGALAGIAGGVFGGRAISGGYSAFGGSGNSAVNTGTAVGAAIGSIVPVIGTALGALVGGLLGGAANRLFGHKPKEVTESGIAGRIYAQGGASGIEWDKWIQKGGVFRSDKTGQSGIDMSPEIAKSLTDAFEAIEGTITGFAQQLGVSSDLMQGYFKEFNLTLPKEEEARQKALTEFFAATSDEIALRLVPSLADLKKEGETASATLERVATNYSVVEQALTAIGMQFGAVGVASISARERLLEAAGGMEAFAANTAGFQQNFLSEQERNAPVLKAVTEQLAALGLAGVDTREEFKQVVLGLDLTTEAGAKQYGSLMKLQAAFAQVYPVIEDTAAALAQVKKGYQDQINEILRGRMSPAELRASDTLSMDPSTIALYDRLAALRLESAAMEKAATESKSLQQQYDELTLTRQQQLDKEREALEPANRARWDEIQAIRAQQSASEQAAAAIKAAADSAKAIAQSFGNAVVDAMKRAEEQAKSLRDFSNSLLLGNLSTLGADAKYREAKRLFDIADPKDTQAAEAFLQASKDRGADPFYYERDFAAVQAKLAKGAADLDAYAASLPAFYLGYAQMLNPALAITNPAPTVAPAVATMSKQSAQQADVSRVEAKLDAVIEKLGGSMEVVANSTAQLAEQFDRASGGGIKLRTEAG